MAYFASDLRRPAPMPWRCAVLVFRRTATRGGDGRSARSPADLTSPIGILLRRYCCARALRCCSRKRTYSHDAQAQRACPRCSTSRRLDQFLAASHVQVPLAGAIAIHALDDALRAQGVGNITAPALPHFVAVPVVLAASGSGGDVAVSGSRIS